MSKQTTKKTGKRKPAIPHPDFPLFAHANGQWAKKVRGKLHYFGLWAEPGAALEKWCREKDFLLAGRKPRASAENGLSIRELCNRFLTAKKIRQGNGEISPRTFADNFSTCARVLREFGNDRLVEDLYPEDFERYRANLGNTLGPVAIGNEVNRVRAIFKFAAGQKIIKMPVEFGTEFKKPSARVMRLQRAKKPRRLFSVKELKKLISAADIGMKAMILLGVNCGLGNSDCSQMEFRHLDLKEGWLNYPRPKTGIDRRCRLWPETIEAIQAAITERPVPKHNDDSKRVFLTRFGQRWVKTNKNGTPADALGQEFTKLLKSLVLHREGLGFYALRHVFETVGGGCKDQVAVNAIMGHADASSSANYREHIEDERLIAVTNHVHRWLFPPKKRKAATKAKASAKRPPRKKPKQPR